jgi:beta-hydroxylase
MSGYLLLYLFDKLYSMFDVNGAFHPTNQEWCTTLRENYEVIRDEYLHYTNKNGLPTFGDVSKEQMMYSNHQTDAKWRVGILRMYNKDTTLTRYFPKTMQLLKVVPGCSLAMFSVLEPGKVIPPHQGVFRGVLRYHLGLLVPPRCRLTVMTNPGEFSNYDWRAGHDVIFDDTYLHAAANDSNEARVVLFLDIRRKFNNVLLDWLTGMFLRLTKYHWTTRDIVAKANAYTQKPGTSTTLKKRT